VADETVTYAYDANDRLLTETLDHVDDAQDRHTVYRYDADGDGVDDDTVQTHKTVHDGLSDADPVIEQTAQQYDPQGRLAQVSATKAGSTTVTDYTYDDDGYRLSRTVVTDGGTPIVTAYLPDTENPTGYTQTLERRVDGELRRSCTLGHDVLAQAETVAQGALQPGEPVVFLHDGHGSTRALVQAVTTAVVQRFAYDAYGNHLLADGSEGVSRLIVGGGGG